MLLLVELIHKATLIGETRMISQNYLLDCIIVHLLIRAVLIS
nr:MAG TPA: hypothetical protein [Caudoviricetes sp.]